MNIFVLDVDPMIAARYHNDKHCVKMILETTQLLSTALPYLVPDKIGPYKPTHVNHPCSKWIRESKGNYMWLWQLGKHLLTEYTYRYGKVHKCAQYYDYLKLDDSSPMTEFALAMPDEYKNSSPVTAYRAYYIGAKRHLASWKNRDVPFWWK